MSSSRWIGESPPGDSVSPAGKSVISSRWLYESPSRESVSLLKVIQWVFSRLITEILQVNQLVISGEMQNVAPLTFSDYDYRQLGCIQSWDKSFSDQTALRTGTHWSLWAECPYCCSSPPPGGEPRLARSLPAQPLTPGEREREWGSVSRPVNHLIPPLPDPTKEYVSFSVILGIHPGLLILIILWRTKPNSDGIQVNAPGRNLCWDSSISRWKKKLCW